MKLQVTVTSAIAIQFPIQPKLISNLSVTDFRTHSSATLKRKPEAELIDAQNAVPQAQQPKWIPGAIAIQPNSIINNDN